MFNVSTDVTIESLEEIWKFSKKKLESLWVIIELTMPDITTKIFQ